jgi:hypothetical protein
VAETPGPDRRIGTVREGETIPRRLAPADRWRLLLGRESGRLPSGARRYAHALDELYGTGRGEGADDFGPVPGDAGGQDVSFPSAREWAEELDALFGSEVREEVLAWAADTGRTDVLTVLDPDAVRPSIELLTSVLSLAGGLPEQQLSRLRPLVRRLVAELAKELAIRMRPAMTGLAMPRPTRRPGGRLNLPATLRANLAHARRTDDGRILVVPERPVFTTRTRAEVDWRLIFVVDVSGSMEASVIWSALTAAVLGGVPILSTHFLAFSTRVIDLTDQVTDPLSLLLDVTSSLSEGPCRPTHCGSSRPACSAPGSDTGGSSSVVEEPPCGEGESGPYESGGLGEFDAQGLSEVFESAGDAAVVQMEKVGGPAQGAGGAVGVQRIQIFWAAGHPGDRGHVGVVSRDVLGYLCEQRQRAQVGVVDDRLA